MPSAQEEFILAQEQGVMAKTSFEREVEGTLVLTNRRLLFVGANQFEDVNTGAGKNTVRFADVTSLASIPQSRYNISIPLNELDFDRGGHLSSRPSLRVKWNDKGEERNEEFVAKLSGAGRKKSLNDWARVIGRLNAGELAVTPPENPTPGIETLEGKILYVLGDMQEKGPLEIEQEVETTFTLDLDPDQVDESCKKLLAEGLVDAVSDSSGENFYRKHSPLGVDDLSS